MQHNALELISNALRRHPSLNIPESDSGNKGPGRDPMPWVANKQGSTIFLARFGRFFVTKKFKNIDTEIQRVVL